MKKFAFLRGNVWRFGIFFVTLRLRLESVMVSIRQHIGEITRLGTPIVIAQLGVVVQGIADTVMVGYALRPHHRWNDLLPALQEEGVGTGKKYPSGTPVFMRVTGNRTQLVATLA